MKREIVERKYRDQEWLEHEYTLKGRTCRDIGEECGVTYQAVHFFVKKLGLTKPRRWQRIDRAILTECRQARMTIDQIAEKLGVPKDRVENAIAGYGIPCPMYSPEERRVRHNESQNRRCAEDPELRARKAATTAAWRKAHPERCREHMRARYARKKAQCQTNSNTS